MGDETQRSGSGASGRPGGDRESSAQRAAVLTPPTGLPALGAIPTQRSAPREDVAQPPAPPSTDAATCLCGHPEEMHEHYRPGDDCGSCGPEACSSFRPPAERSPRRRPLDRWRR